MKNPTPTLVLEKPKSWTRNPVMVFWNLVVQSLKHGPHCEWKDCSQEPIKDKVEEQDQTPILGRAPQELSGGPVVDEKLPLGQALVEGQKSSSFFVMVCVAAARWAASAAMEAARNAQACPGWRDAARRRRQKAQRPAEESSSLRWALKPLRPLKPNVFQKWILKWVMGFGKVGFRKGLKWHSSVQLTHLREKWWTLNFNHLYPDYHGSSMAAETILLAGVGWLTQVGI